MKVVMIVARLNVGGVALNVLQTAEALTRVAGCEVIVVHGNLGAGEGDMGYLADELGVRTLLLPGLGRELSPRRDIGTLWRLWRLLRQLRPDVVHTHTAKAGFVGRWAAWLAGVPVRVHTFHGHVFQGYFSPRKTQIFLLLERLSARVSSRIVTLSERLKTDLAEVYRVAGQEKIAVLPLGLDLTPYADLPRGGGAFRVTYHIPPDAPLIAVVGRLVPIKNHHLFLEAAHLTHQQRPDVHFAIVGDGECRPEIETWIQELGLSEAVTLTGWVRDTASVYRACDLITMTSLNEGTPVSVIEALAAGVPVVATDVGGVADVLGAELAGQRVPLEAAALSVAWLQTLDTPPDLSLARPRMFSTYGIDANAAQLAALYKELA